MSCCWDSWNARLLLLVLTAAALLPCRAGAEAQALLEVRSASGYSRFEISDDQVVVFYTGGIEFTYLNYSVKAEELRYNKATQVAVATGAVDLRYGGARARAERLRLDGIAGEMLLEGHVALEADEPQAVLEADALVIQWSPELLDEADLSGSSLLQHADAGLQGQVEFAGAGGLRLSTTGVDYRAEGRRLRLPRPFVARGSSDDLRMASPGADGESLTIDLSEWTVEGSSMVGALGAESRLASVEIGDVDCESPQCRLSAREISVADVTADDAAEPWSTWELRAKHLSTTVVLPSGQMQGSAAEATLVITDENLEHIDLMGGVALDYGGVLLACERLLAVGAGDGFQVRLPGEVTAEFDLAALSGIQPLSLADWSGRE